QPGAPPRGGEPGADRLRRRAGLSGRRGGRRRRGRGGHPGEYRQRGGRRGRRADDVRGLGRGPGEGRTLDFRALPAEPGDQGRIRSLEEKPEVTFRLHPALSFKRTFRGGTMLKKLFAAAVL